MKTVLLFLIFSPLALFAQRDSVFSDTIPANLRTYIAPGQEEILREGVNVVYSAAFPVSWDVFRKTVHVQPEEAPAWLKKMHEAPADSSINAKYLVSMAGTNRTNIVARINADRRKKFGATDLIKPALADSEVFIYSEFRKSLKFDPPLLDSGVKVISSAFSSENGFSYLPIARGSKSLGKSIFICYHHNDNDYAIRLKASGSEDEIYMAEMPRPRNLRDGYDSLMKYCGQKDYYMLNDRMRIPYVRIDETQENASLKTARFAYPVKLLSQKSSIHFALTENGIVVKAEEQLKATSGRSSSAEPRSFTFDQPFLIVMKEAGKSQPYFMAWISNTDLLVPYKK